MKRAKHRHLTSRERWQLTRGGVVDWFAWSPRGDELLLSTRAPDGNTGGLFVQGTDGATPRRIDAAAQDTSAGRRASWSPDGSQLAFADGDALMIVDRQGANGRRFNLRLPQTGLRQAAGDSVSLGTPAWYPDGLRLLVPMVGRSDLGPGDNTRIRFYSLAVADGAVAPVGADLPLLGGRLPNNTSFAPNSQAFGYTTVAYVSSCEAYGFFARLDPASNTLQMFDPQVGPPPALRFSPQAESVGSPGAGLYPRGYSWAPDGRRVALAFAYRDCNAGANGPSPAQLFVASLTGEVLGLGRGTSPSWSPRGDQIAYVADEATRTIRVRDLTASTERDLGAGEQPAWQPLPR